ncbi:MAG: tetratricopeptide repeat protein [Bacteroidales bacterium]|nr:tetratricopeptide repeat protein [Bacteroidales bacterium]
MNKKLLVVILLLATVTLSAQTVEKQIRKGNRQYRKGNYSEAEVQYRKALDAKPMSAEAQFNLGDALYRQENYKDAMDAFQKVLEMTPDTKLKSQAVFNMGNCLLEQEKYYDAFNTYKIAIKFNPENKDALYNLEYCRAHLVKSHVWVNPQIPHGMVEASESMAFNGQMVTLTSKAEGEYALSQYVVVKADDQQVTVPVSGSRFEMPKFDVIVTGEFKPLRTITIDQKIAHGKISADRKKAVEGQQVTLHAQPDPKYMVDAYFVTKTGNPQDTVPVNDTVFQMPDFDVTVSARFRTALRVQVDSTEHGQIQVTDSLALPGQNIGVIVKPDAGYQLNELYVVSDKDPSTTAPVSDLNVFQMLDDDVTVKASFVEAQEYYKVLPDTLVEGGHVLLDVEKATRGETVTLRNAPEPGYQFKEYKICQLTDTAVQVQPLGNFFTMPGFDVMVSAVFEKQEGENQDQQQNQQDQQQEQQDQQDQQQDQDQQNQQDQQQQQQQQQNPQDMSKDDAQRMLDALENQEKKTMEKVNEQKIRTQPKRKTDKDW